MRLRQPRKARAGAHEQLRNGALRCLGKYLLAAQLILPALIVGKSCRKRVGILRGNLLGRDVHAEFVMQEVQKHICLGVEAGGQRNGVAGVHAAHGVTRDAYARSVNIRESAYIVVCVQRAENRAAAGRVIGGVSEVGVAVTVHIHCKHDKAPARQLDRVRILHLVAVQIAVAQNYCRARGSVVPEAVVLKRVLGDVEHAGKRAAAGADLHLANERVPAVGLHNGGDNACKEHNGETYRYYSPIFFPFR